MTRFLGFTKPTKYKNLLDSMFDKNKVIQEIKTISELLKLKISLEQLILGNKALTDEEKRQLGSILTKLLERFEEYQRFYRIVTWVSERTNNKIGSSQIIVQGIGRIKSNFNISFEQVISHLNDSLRLLRSNQIEEYFELQKSISHVNPQALQAAQQKFLRREKSIIFPISIALSTALILFTSTQIVPYKAYYQVIMDEETDLHSAFYQKYGIKIYGNDKGKIKLIYEVMLGLDLGNVVRTNVSRIVIVEGEKDGAFTPLTSELILGSDTNGDDFVESFFHELGHAIHRNLKDKGKFDREFKALIEKGEAYFEKKKSLTTILKENEYNIFRMLFQHTDEAVARVYAARMLDIFYFYEDHKALAPINKIMEESIKDERNRIIIGEILALMHKNGFFGSLPLD